MLSPKRVKYRKPHLTPLRGYAKGATKVDFGEYGLQACENGSCSNKPQDEKRRKNLDKNLPGSPCDGEAA